MAKRVEPWNPNTAAWLVAQRGARTQDQVVAELAERGVKVRRAWLSRIENGAKFGADLLTAFEDYYGSVPPPYVPPIDPPATDQAAILNAIVANTKAVNDLVALLTPLLGDKATDVVGRLDKLDDRVKRLSRQAIGAPPEPPVPLGTKG